MTVKKDAGEPRSPEEKIISNYLFSLVSKDKQIWKDMAKVAGADEMIATAEQIAGPNNVYILSSPVGDPIKDKETGKVISPPSVVAKKEWIAAKDHFPQIDPDNVLVDREKGARLRSLINVGRVSENDLNILIDDRRKFLDDFIAAGGIGIQYNFESPGRAFQELERIIAN